jgi:hypothetical protein
MDDRSRDVLDTEHPNPKHHTTHVHAYVRASGGWYTLFVCPYAPETAASLAGIRRYPLSATKAEHIETCSRFSAKRLATLAADPAVVNLARTLAGM